MTQRSRKGLIHGLQKSFYFLFVFLGPVAFVLGVYHAFSKHSPLRGAASIVFFPIAWYHAAEYFWHDDFAGVDWDERLSSDYETTIYFLNQPYQTEMDTFRVNQDLEEFSTILQDYPAEHRASLETAIRSHICAGSA